MTQTRVMCVRKCAIKSVVHATIEFLGFWHVDILLTWNVMWTQILTNASFWCPQPFHVATLPINLVTVTPKLTVVHTPAKLRLNLVAMPVHRIVTFERIQIIYR